MQTGWSPMANSGQRFQHFGAALRHYRESYQERTRQHHPDGPRIRITALSLIGCMQRRGYSISSGGYSEIESGASIPKDPRRFLQAVTTCLAITEGSDEWRALVQQLGYDIVARKLGAECADVLFPQLRRPGPQDVERPTGE